MSPSILAAIDCLLDEYTTPKRIDRTNQCQLSCIDADPGNEMLYAT
jgi:hypothetical protein